MAAGRLSRSPLFLRSVASQPWGPDGQCPDYAFCPCCEVEAGYEDSTLAAIRDYRRAWLAEGASWSMPNYQLVAWDLGQQLENIPPQYR